MADVDSDEAEEPGEKKRRGGRFREAVATAQDFDIATLSSLPPTLHYVGEFGAELVLFHPFCNWLSRTGLLRDRRIKTYRGMRCFYDEMDCAELVLVDQPRKRISPANREPWLPVRYEHVYVPLSPYHAFSDFRRKFKKLPLPASLDRPDKPLLVVHNKFTTEFRSPPMNFIPPSVVDQMLSSLERAHTVVYIRHGMSLANHPGFSGDRQQTQDFGDRPVLDAHSDVLNFDDLFAEYGPALGHDVNMFKNALYSRCYRFISVQGGGAHQIAMFSGSLMVILHKWGRETERAYRDGFYSFMSNPAPIRLICENEEQLLRAMAVFDGTGEAAGRALVGSEKQSLVQEFSPWRLRGIQRRARNAASEGDEDE